MNVTILDVIKVNERLQDEIFIRHEADGKFSLQYRPDITSTYKKYPDSFEDLGELFNRYYAICVDNGFEHARMQMEGIFGDRIESRMRFHDFIDKILALDPDLSHEEWGGTHSKIVLDCKLHYQASVELPADKEYISKGEAKEIVNKIYKGLMDSWDYQSDDFRNEIEGVASTVRNAI